MTETLYTPDAEHVATSNAWAFLHWARWGAAGSHPPTPDQVRGRRPLPQAGEVTCWSEIVRWSAEEPEGFASALTAFASSSASEFPLPLWEGVRGRGPENRQATAKALLHADLRPDDRVLLAAPWQPPPLPGTTFIQAQTSDLLGQTATGHVTVLIADAVALSRTAFQHPGPRPDLARLRTVIALGSPMASEARARLYTWVKPDILLLAQAGDLLWGSPLDAVPLHPAPPCRFFRA